MVIEIEDTGNGMSAEAVEKLLTSMREADISMLEKKSKNKNTSASVAGDLA